VFEIKLLARVLGKEFNLGQIKEDFYAMNE